MADSMLIDGLIKFCDEKSKNIKLKAEPQVFVEIKQALEELKIYKECNISKTNFVNGYNKAIDEFAENLKRKILEEIYDVSDRQKNYEVGSDMSMTCSHIMGTLRDVRHRIVDDVAEQMKAGGIDE